MEGPRVLGEIWFVAVGILHERGDDVAVDLVIARRGRGRRVCGPYSRGA